ncbi:MAG: hypothetical protein LBT09_11860 [Planctomycetaceae bacterium]|jgi:hypothetical protein|nr:hypothetical protein [Planctomycetaceae bacterium]
MKRLVCILAFVSLLTSGLEVFAQPPTKIPAVTKVLAEMNNVTITNSRDKTIFVAIAIETSRSRPHDPGPGSYTLGALFMEYEQAYVGWFAIEPKSSRTFNGRNGADKFCFALRSEGKFLKPTAKSKYSAGILGWCCPPFKFDLRADNKRGGGIKIVSGSIEGESFTTPTYSGSDAWKRYDTFYEKKGLVKTPFYKIPKATGNIKIDSWDWIFQY